MLEDGLPRLDDFHETRVSPHVILDHWVDSIYAILHTAVGNGSILANRLVPMEVYYHVRFPIGCHRLAD